MTEAVKVGLSDFISEIKGGMAVTNRFFVSIGSVNPIAGSIARRVGLFCESASIPGKNILTTPARTYGEVRETPYEVAYEPMNLVLYVDKNYQVKEYFDTWQSSIFNDTARYQNYYNDYTQDVTVYVYNKEEDAAFAIKLFQAYPKVVAPINLDNNSKDIAKLTVTLQYKYWRREPLAGVDANAQRSNVGGKGAAGQLAEELGIDDAFGALDLGNAFDFGNVLQNYFTESSLFGAPSEFLSSFSQFQNTFNSFQSDPVGTFLGGGGSGLAGLTKGLFG
jgi:hypothetical protein